jgi:hypothetical protein
MIGALMPARNQGMSSVLERPPPPHGVLGWRNVDPEKIDHPDKGPDSASVLGRWKMAAIYCQAVLSHDQRIALDGAPAETVDAEAKDLAAKQLARLAARPRKQRRARALAVVKPKSAPAPALAPPTKTPQHCRQ